MVDALVRKLELIATPAALRHSERSEESAVS